VLTYFKRVCEPDDPGHGDIEPLIPTPELVSVHMSPHQTKFQGNLLRMSIQGRSVVEELKMNRSCSSRDHLRTLNLMCNPSVT
jgi:hypothetical protein